MQSIRRKGNHLMVTKKKKFPWFQILNYAFFAFCVIMVLYPFWYVFIGSVTPYEQFSQMILKLWPKEFTLQAYKQIMFVQKNVMRAMGLTAGVTFAGCGLSMFLTILGAYVFSAPHFPGKNLIVGLIVFTMLFSGGMVPMYVLLHKIHILDTPFVYFLPNAINVFYLLILRTAFHELPDGLREAAEIDGCGHWRMVFYFVVPLSMPAIATVALFYMVDRWNDLYTGIYYIISPKYYSLQVVLYNMLSGENQVNSLPVGSAGTLISEQVKYASILISTIPIICVYPFLQKYYTKGVMVGAIKD